MIGTMPDPKGDKLFVKTSASEARRRLKGFGHGVRKVQSAGRNQAVIIHTSTGRHLEELVAKFADVGLTGMPYSKSLAARIRQPLTQRKDTRRSDQPRS